MRAGSLALYTSTERWAYIASVRVLLPATWGPVDGAIQEVNEVYDDAQVL